MVPPIPVLEIGGTHVTSALVSPADWSVTGAVRVGLDGDAPADALLDTFGSASIAIPDGMVCGVAMPDPFDYERGIGLFAGVGKFGALRGVDVGAALRERLRAPVAFVNDADAFALGEWTAGAGRGAARCVGITLGTGVGSGWLVGGTVVDPGDPPAGRIHRVTIGGAPLEDVVSRRAIRRAFVAATGDTTADVRDICALARAGDDTARGVLDTAFGVLGEVVAPLVAAFGADVLVIGGSMSASWDVLGPAFDAGAGQLPEVRLALRRDDAGLIGAAVHAQRVASAQ